MMPSHSCGTRLHSAFISAHSPIAMSMSKPFNLPSGPQIARAMRIGWAMGIGCTGGSRSRTLQSPPPSWPVPMQPRIAPLRPAR